MLSLSYPLVPAGRLTLRFTLRSRWVVSSPVRAFRRRGCAAPPWKRRPDTTARLGSEKFLHGAVAVEDRCAVLGQTTGVRCRTVRRVQRLAPRTQVGGQLSAMVCRVREPTDENPCARTRDFKELGSLFEPALRLARQRRQAFFRDSGVVFEERETRLLLGKRWTADRDSQHGLHPCVFARALMDHVFQRSARPWFRTKPHLRVRNLRPDAEGLEAFRAVGVDQEVVCWHVGSVPPCLSDDALICGARTRQLQPLVRRAVGLVNVVAQSTSAALHTHRRPNMGNSARFSGLSRYSARFQPTSSLISSTAIARSLILARRRLATSA